MQQRCLAANDPDVEAWGWLIDAIAAEIATGNPHRHGALIAALAVQADGPARRLVERIAARVTPQPAGLGGYLGLMFRDPD